MDRRFVPLHPEGLGLIAYGHHGRPLLAFPSEQGYSHDYESMGMVAAIADLIEAGRVKLYCVDSIDGDTWHTTGALDSTKRFAALLEEKGLRHELDLWGYDVPHDWPSWCAQLAHHLPRFC